MVSYSPLNQCINSYGISYSKVSSGNFKNSYKVVNRWAISHYTITINCIVRLIIRVGGGGGVDTYLKGGLT